MNFLLGVGFAFYLWVELSHPPTSVSEHVASIALAMIFGAGLTARLLAWAIDAGKTVYQRKPPTGDST